MYASGAVYVKIKKYSSTLCYRILKTAISDLRMRYYEKIHVDARAPTICPRVQRSRDCELSVSFSIIYWPDHLAPKKITDLFSRMTPDLKYYNWAWYREHISRIRSMRPSVSYFEQFN